MRSKHLANFAVAIPGKFTDEIPRLLFDELLGGFPRHERHEQPVYVEEAVPLVGGASEYPREESAGNRAFAVRLPHGHEEFGHRPSLVRIGVEALDGLKEIDAELRDFGVEEMGSLSKIGST